MLRLIPAVVLALFLTVLSAQFVPAQDADDARAATGGAQTLEDIMARQRGETVDSSFRKNATGSPDDGAGLAGQLGPLGGASDAEVFRALRYGTADVTVSANGPAAGVLIQDGGMKWLQYRQGPLRQIGGYLLLATLVLLALFYLVRGKIRIEGEKTGETVTRFSAFERFGHWLLGGSFILLAVTGLISLFGRTALIPIIGKETFAPLALACKWVHNNVAWAFILGLIMVFVMWIAHNIPNRADLNWLARGGGLFTKGSHPPARKFNAGQKIVFWSVVLLGGTITLTGLSLLFPFKLPFFAETFTILNATGLPQLVGFGELPTQITPQVEMQLTQIWHSVIAFTLMAVAIAHIYLGSVGMEGAFDAMNSGEVETQWAKEHHSLWFAELSSQEGNPAGQPEASPAE